MRMFPVGAGGWVSREAWFAALCDWQLVEASADGWDAAVAAAFASFDRDGDQLLSRRELETLLCGEAGCEVRCMMLRCLLRCMAVIEVLLSWACVNCMS